MTLDFDSSRLPNPYLTPAHEAWRAQLRKFIDKELMPYRDEWDEAGEIPSEIWLKAADMGILGLGYPEEYGGITEGIDPWYFYILNDEIARLALGGLPSAVMVHNIGLPPVVNFAAEHIKADITPKILAGTHYISLGLTEPDGGSDLASLKTTAVRDGDYYVVNGSKTFISGGMRANWVSTAVRTGGAGAGGVSMLLIPTDLPGFSRTALDKKMGWWCSDTATLYFDHVRVPADHLIGPENRGFQVVMDNLNSERLAMCGHMAGYARVCLQEAVKWAQNRYTFGARLADHQVIRHKIADMKMRINATDSYILAVIKNMIDGVLNPGDLALLKVQSSLTMEYCAREAMQILGGAGYLRGNPVERIYREVRVNAIGGGSEEIMRDLAARQFGV